VLAAGTGDNTVHFWRLSGPDAGSEMSGFEGPPFRPIALAWHGTTLATGGDTTIALWSFRGKGPEGTEPRGLVSHRALVTHLAFAEKTGALASASRSGELLLWDSPRSSEPAGGIRLDGAVTALCLRPDGTRLFAGAERGRVLACRIGEQAPGN
jgi:WD40 repeat protein